jgi:hypothetical protein
MNTTTGTASQTYTKVDIEKVVRRFTADLLMIAQSTGAITEATARDWANDVELLAKNEYLASVDLTLLDNNGLEVRAVRYTVNNAAGELETSRPGGVMWPRMANPFLRIVLYYNTSYTAAAQVATQPRLKVAWSPTGVNTSHASLVAGRGRDYASNGWGMQRKDYGA